MLNVLYWISFFLKIVGQAYFEPELELSVVEDAEALIKTRCYSAACQ